jgi:hypothetical protein
MTNSQSKHPSESPLHPKRTQEIATILCLLLGREIELPRKIIGYLKDAETERDRVYHMSLIRPHHLIAGIKSVNEESIKMYNEGQEWWRNGVQCGLTETLQIIGRETRERIYWNMIKRGMSEYEIYCFTEPLHTGVLFPHWHNKSGWRVWPQPDPAEYLLYDQDGVEM